MSMMNKAHNDIWVFADGTWAMSDEWEPEWETRDVLIVRAHTPEWRLLLDGETPESLDLC